MNPQDKNSDTQKEFKQEEKTADKAWEEVKDDTSGVDKDLEEKLENNDVTPKDLDTMNG